MSNWYFARDGVQNGPYSLDEMRMMVAAGQVGPDDMVWADGMPQWSTVASAPALAGSVPASGYAYPQAYPPQHPGGVPGLGYYAPRMTVSYAGFWTRFCAVVIDGVILGVASVIFTAILRLVTDRWTAELISNLVGIVVQWLWDAGFESSAMQGTPGKQLMGIKVTDMSGGRISFARATGRHFGKYLSAIILLIGYIMAAFSERKQALHDMMAGTLVVRK